MSFLMQVSSDDVFDGINIAWACIYFLLNGGLVIMHWSIAPVIKAWIKAAKIISDVIEKEEIEEEETADTQEEDFDQEDEDFRMVQNVGMFIFQSSQNVGFSVL